MGPKLLSRIAESLYWLGRYVERAEDTARILDVHFHLLLEDRWVDEQVAGRVLLTVMGFPAADGEASDSVLVTRALAFDSDYSGSIVRSLEAAWENARGAREAVSSEMWECLNATHEALPDQIEAATGQMPHAFFWWVKERAAILGGLSESTMSRDEGWRFLMLGRSLERADMTARLLSARYGESWGQMGWVTTLRSCSAYEAYLRTYHRAVDGSSAAEFLVLDRLFPRSLYFALRSAENSLDEIAPRAGRAGVEDLARRHLGQARAELEFTSASDLLADLPGHLGHVQKRCSAASAAISERYFRPAAIVEWSA
ncbi:MAG TPA: alpha-E domain-containing protein [Acidimicrobiales bacterium]|nr:alpha-E domain-containing protein [Acidimicrobiales bacterium]